MQSFLTRTMSTVWDALSIVPGEDAGKLREEIAKEVFCVKQVLDKPYVTLPQEQLEHEVKYSEFLTLDTAPATASIRFIKSGLYHDIVGYSESSKRPSDEDASFMSLGVAGSSESNNGFGAMSGKPLAPGGMEDVLIDTEMDFDVDEMQLRIVPPGFQRGYFDDNAAPIDVSIQAPAWAADVEASAPNKEVHTVITVEDDGEYMPEAERPARHDLEASFDKRLAEAPVPRLFEEATEELDFDEAEKRAMTRRTWAHTVEPSKKMHNFHEVVPDMAHKYPFELDNFQKQAIFHLEGNDTVFVAAHTSAGKTVVAEYAIALAMKHLTRCIYTSPIKALSNQKFREFKLAFGANNVGIITGDVQINAEAPCLIMTTEVLRTMLYRGATLLRDVEFVIFDEVHYVNDLERGVVWEEVIIMLPSHVNIVLLSATVPNAKEFADWIGRTKHRDVYVVSTPKRPVPLEHFLYAKNDLYKIVDAQGTFQTPNLHKAADALKPKQERELEASAGRGGGPGRGRGAARGGGTSRGGAPARGRGGTVRPRTSMMSDRSLWVHLVGLLRKRSLLPVVVFVFSKARCEEYADSLPNTNLSTAAERSEVHVLIERSLTRLREEDRSVPQILRMRELLQRGIGVHHSGLLPIVKELVELLFQRGLVKVLFATETFAMGVNMPARSVVFSGIRKNDGKTFRNLLPGEYTQMSGRAGRRGLDDTGVVIILSDNPDLPTLNYMILGEPLKLRSQFRITYGMVLNLLRIETLKIEEMIKRSFSENAAQRLQPEQEDKLKRIRVQDEKTEAALAQLPVDKETVNRVYQLSDQAVKASRKMLSLAFQHAQGSKQLGPGRVVLVYTAECGMAVGVILMTNVRHKHSQVLVAASREQLYKRPEPQQAPYWLSSHTLQSLAKDDLVADMYYMPYTNIALVTSMTIDDLSISGIQANQMLAVNSALKNLASSAEELREHLEQAGSHTCQAVLELETDWSRMRSIHFFEAQRDRNAAIEQLVAEDAVLATPHFGDAYALVHKRRRMGIEMAKIQASLSVENLELLPDYHQRFAVLCALGYIEPDTNNISMKGYVASQIRSVNELVLADLIVREFLVQFEPPELAALLSVFHFRDKTQVVPEMTTSVQDGLEEIRATADRIANVQLAHQLPPDDDASTLNDGLVQVVYEWANGMQFRDIMRLTDVGEGTIVRVITRLDETFREIRECARLSGDAVLQGKMDVCRELCRRDIVFAASLYL